jgi:hypothetical protein
VASDRVEEKAMTPAIPEVLVLHPRKNLETPALILVVSV